MFAGAAREVVFSNPEVVRRVNDEFIPVALKAALVNNPPRGIEGDLYAEISRTKPAPQGICTANADGKVLTWALSFDDDASILKFLDHVGRRFNESPDAKQPVTAERFMKFPSRKLSDVKDNERLVTVPMRHGDERCPAKPALQKGTLVGRIIGRPLDKDGQPIADTTRQEHYMEARFEVPVAHQQLLAAALKNAADKPFAIPDEFARDVITHAFLGQLDVNPLGDVPGSRNESRKWEFTGRQVDAPAPDIARVRLEGTSDVAGGQDTKRSPRTDGRLWEHRVSLTWQGYVDLKDGRVHKLVMLAEGDERLRWGNARFRLLEEADAEHLMAGHPIDLDCRVRYGLIAEPCPADEVADAAIAKSREPGDLGERIQAKMRQLQTGLRRLQQSGGNPAEIARLMKDFGPLMQQQKPAEAETLLDRALELLDHKINEQREP